ncbi:MAG: LytR family transcriptional regulator, partial [Coriobacteriaceae bacterium]|nr:LytR family transcriptional regulator [Coriobacteriaceae bacterium]
MGQFDPNELSGYSRGVSSQRYSTATKRSATKKKVVLAVVIILVALLAVAGVAVATFLHNVNNNIAIDEQNLEDLKEQLVAPQQPDEPYYTLLIGSDSRDPSDSGRSDTIILMRVDPKVPQVTLLSIPRDTEIQLEGYGTQKINAAFSYGREAGAVKAVSELCGVPIAHFVEIDFQGVIDLVDMLGGVRVNVPVDVELNGISIPAGEQFLDGEKALLFSRCRNYPTGDFQRVINQRILIQAIAKEVLRASATEIPALIDKLSTCVATDVSATDAIAMVMAVRGLDTQSNM